MARFSPALGQACRKALRRSGRPSGPQEADDMVQTVFVHLLQDDRRALRAWRGESSLEGYLSVVAAHKTLKDRLLAPRAPPAPRPPEPPEPEGLESMRRGMEGLPPRDRLALTLQSEGASLREIGGALGLTEGAAAQVLSRARARLREIVRQISPS